VGGREGRGFLSALRKYWISSTGLDRLNIDEKGSDGDLSPRNARSPLFEREKEGKERQFDMGGQGLTFALRNGQA